MWSSRYSKEKENVYDLMISLRSWLCTILKSTGSCSIEFKDIEIIWNTNDMNVCGGIKIECRDKYQKAVVSGHSNIETWILLWNLYWFQISCIHLSLLFNFGLINWLSLQVKMTFNNDVIHNFLIITTFSIWLSQLSDMGCEINFWLDGDIWTKITSCCWIVYIL